VGAGWHVLTLHKRRRIGGTVTYTTNRHAQSWRDQAANDDGLDAARGILLACALGALAWAVIGGLLWWAVEVYVGAQ
jgi:hypothetical protein